MYVSDKFAEIMMSNVRPKCEPIIRASKKNSDGSQTIIEWKAKDIKNFTYKHGIDPVGRTLPYIELTWTEIYKEKEDFEETKKYLSASKFMAVNFSVTQNLGFYNNWKSLYDSVITWKEIFNRGTNWKELKNKVNTETIDFPVLFLEDKPVIDNMTITWTAKDLLSFLNKPIKKTFVSNDGIPFFEPIETALNENRNEFLNYPEILDSIDLTIQSLNNAHTSFNPNLYLNKSIFVDSDTKNFLLNYASIESIYWKFRLDGSLYIDYFDYWYLSPLNKTSFMKKTMFNIPKKIKNSSISNYLFKTYKFDNNNNWVSEDDSFKISDFGENYIENNPINPYSSNLNDVMNKRKNFLSYYFDTSKKVIEFEGLPHFEFSPNDIVEIQSNDFYANGNPIMYEAIIILNEINYNGSFRQKIIAHETEVAKG